MSSISSEIVDASKLGLSMMFEPRALTPDQRLWCAVLLQAMREAIGKKKRAAKAARAWFLSAEMGECSFRWVTQILGLEGARNLILNIALKETLAGRRKARRLSQWRNPGAYYYRQAKQATKILRQAA